MILGHHQAISSTWATWARAELRHYILPVLSSPGGLGGNHKLLWSSAASWLIRRWGAVVGTTKYSEQNHNLKEKNSNWKKTRGLNSHEPFSESDFPSIIGPVPGVSSSFRAGRWLRGIRPSCSLRQEWATAQSGHARALPNPNFATQVLSMEGCSAAHRLPLSSNHHVDFSRREYNQTASIYPRMMRAASVLAWMLIL